MNVKWLQHRIGRGLGAASIATVLACGSEGPAGPTGPQGPSGAVPIFVTTAGSASLVLNDSVFRYAQIPGLSATVTVPAGSTYKLLAETDAGIQVNSVDPSATCFTDVAVFLDGVQVGSGRRVAASNTQTVLYSVSSFGFSVQANVPAGTHTVAVMAKQYAAIVAECYVSSGPSGSALPGNPRLQGILNVIALP